MTAPSTTLFNLSGGGVPPYSARGLQQTLELVSQAGQLRRNVNGALLDLSAPQFRKYKSTVQCTDQAAPAVDGVWPGATVTVDCVVELCFNTDSGAQGRAAVPGSIRVEDATTEDDSYTFYRPRLSMIVVSYHTNVDEWGATVGWTLELEEV